MNICVECGTEKGMYSICVSGMKFIWNVHVVGNCMFETNLQIEHVTSTSKCNYVLVMWLPSVIVFDLSRGTC